MPALAVVVFCHTTTFVERSVGVLLSRIYFFSGSDFFIKTFFVICLNIAIFVLSNYQYLYYGRSY